jgi:hypothetical protein
MVTSKAPGDDGGGAASLGPTAGREGRRLAFLVPRGPGIGLGAGPSTSSRSS